MGTGNLINRVKMVHQVIRTDNFTQMSGITTTQTIILVAFFYKNVLNAIRIAWDGPRLFRPSLITSDLIKPVHE